jgi:di/tricarboxylate transporter
VYRDLYIISKLRELAKPGRKKYYAIASIVACTAALLFFGNLSLFPSLLIVLSIMIGFNLITTQDVKRELDVNLIAILVFSLAIGVAIVKTGAGAMVAGGLMDVFAPYGTISLLIGLAVITNVLTTFIVNIGAVSITFPVAMSLSQNMHIDGTPFFLAIAFAASGAFMSPIGYQTNLIVFGPGGYAFKDFVRVGVPVNIIYLLTALSLIILLYRDALLA